MLDILLKCVIIVTNQIQAEFDDTVLNV